jgi:hypothetical protein
MMNVVSSGPQAPMRTSQAFETRALRRTSNISHLHPYGEQQSATPCQVSSHCLSTYHSLMSASLSTRFARTRLCAVLGTALCPNEAHHQLRTMLRRSL